MPAKPAAKPTTKTVAKAPASKAASTTRAKARTATPETPAITPVADPRPIRPLAERADLIAQAAYYRAEQRGFAGNDTLGDWVAAEQEVDAAWQFA